MMPVSYAAAAAARDSDMSTAARDVPIRWWTTSD